MNKGNIDGNTKQQLIKKINTLGGWVNCHAHFDRAYTITPKTLNWGHQNLNQKWVLVDEMKRNSSEEIYTKRIEKAIKTMIAQDVKYCVTFIDVDPISKFRAVRAAQAIKKKYAHQCTLFIVNQVLKGVVDSVARRWAEKALDYVDIIGGLPSKDRPYDEKHLDILFSWAKETGKMLHIHIDQENNPWEHDTQLLAKKTIQYGLEGRVVAIHAVSVAAHTPKDRKEIYHIMKSAGMSVVCCPSAAISMKPVEGVSVIHNSIAPVVELLEEGIPVALGVDNIADIYQPFVDGDLYTELRFLAEANRFYDIDTLAAIGSVNGRKVLGVS